jgi:DNA-binding transcriptional LysR family regulator
MEEGSIAKAAIKMSTASSNVSLQISTLEEELGIKLFIREKKRLKPTEEALKIFNLAKQYLIGIDEIYTNTNQVMKDVNSKVIRIAGHSYALSHLLPKYYKQIIAIDSKVKFEILNVDLNTAINHLITDAVDVIAFPFENNRTDVFHINLHKVDFVLVLPKNHPLCNIVDDKISWHDIAKYDVINLGRKFATVEYYASTIKYFNFKSRFKLSFCNWEIGIGIFKQGLGICCIDRTYVSDLPNVILKDVNHLFPILNFDICIKKNKAINKPIVKQFLKLIEPSIIDEIL